MSKEGMPNIPKPRVERESVASVPDREQDLKAQIEELEEARDGFHASSERNRSMRHRIVGAIHRLQDEMEAPEVSSESLPSFAERMKDLEKRIQRQQEILRTIPEDSRIRRAPQETLLARYMRELEGLKKEGQISVSFNSERRMQTLRDRIVFTEGLVASAPDSKLEKIHEATLLRDKAELETLEHAHAERVPEEPEIPSAHEYVVPEAVPTVQEVVSEVEKEPVMSTQPDSYARAQDMIDYLNARHASGSSTPKEESLEKDRSPKESVLSPVAQEVLPTPEKVRAESFTRIDAWTERYLASQFNIKREDIESIKGFTQLTAPQQKFICENLAQLTLGNVQEDAARVVSKAVGARKDEMIQNYGRFFGGALAGVREVFAGGYTKLKTEKEIAARMQSGGMAEHGALLSELVQNMASRGPRIHENAKGELIVDLLNIRERARDKSTRDAEWFAMNELNVLAHELAQTPAEWRGQTLGVAGGEEWKLTRLFKEKVLKTKGAVQENTYAKREEEYERAKRNLEDILRKKGENDLKIAETLIGLDSRVHQLQTLRTNPDAIEELSRIKDKDFFVESAKQVLSGPGAYMALGAVGRTFGGAAIGFFGAPIAAGLLGSLRSWNRTAAELRERDRNARAGVRDTKKGALNVVSAERAEQVVMVDGKTMQNGLTAKLERLLTQAQYAEGADKKRLLAQLRARVEYVHDKERLHRIEYGAVQGRISRHVALVETLGKALAYIAEEELATNTEVTNRVSKTQSRLKKTLDRTEEAIIAARVKGRRSELVKSAAVAASFSVAGALIADYFQKDSVPLGTEDTVVPPETASGASRLEMEPHTPSPEAFAPYTIKQGDTLWDILSQKTTLAELGETRARENAVANIIKSLSAGELQDIGITSGDARKIYPGDTINMEKLSAFLTEHKGIIENARTRFGTLPIDIDPTQIIPSQPEK